MDYDDRDTEEIMKELDNLGIEYKLTRFKVLGFDTIEFDKKEYKKKKEKQNGLD